jgi:hypothetical protein
MDLLDRYLQAVKFWLPSAHRQDIIAELSEDLRSQVEDQEAALGRPLTGAEIEAILRHVGRPVLVASRYLPQRHLIGPVWFPIYAFVLKIVVACSLVPWILVWVGLMMFDPAYRAGHTGAGWLDALGAAWGGFWLAATIAIGVVTIVFAVLERAQATSGLLENWDPRKLPAVRDTRRIPRLSSTLDLVANVVFCSWWIVAMRSSLVLDRPDVRMALAPAWNLFFVGFLILALVNIVAAGVNLLRPYWTRGRAAVRLVTDVAGSALFVALCRSNIIASLTVAGATSARTGRIVDTINHVMFQVWPIVMVVGLIVLGVDIHRLIRAGDTGPQPAHGVPNGGLPNNGHGTIPT